MRSTLIPALALLATACGPQAEAPPVDTSSPTPAASAPEPLASTAPLPDLARCPRYPREQPEGRERKGPLVFPGAFADILATDVDHVAVTTLTGATVCIDARHIDSIEDPRQLADRRFVGFDWYGYEAYGHILFDRAGGGQEIDTGAAPVASPSKALLAAVESTESGFGALNGLGVWQVLPDSVKQLAVTEVPGMLNDWQIDRWQGDACIELSAIASEDLPDSPADYAKAPRKRFAAGPGGGTWRLAPGTCAPR